MNREQVLKEALKIVTNDRQKNYGTPEDNFSIIANLWGSYLGCKISTTDVALLMVLLKIARARSNNGYVDNYVDIAGYAACAGELNDKE